MERLGVQPGQTMMVGDWPERDMKGAANLGITTVYASYGDNYTRLEGNSTAVVPGADYIIDDISEILEILGKINGD